MTEYLTGDLPGIGGRIKERVEDFCVEELPLYPPNGEGEHTFFEMRKAGQSTFQAVRDIARALGVPTNWIGYAGLKDAQAITSQVLSVQGVPPEFVRALDLPGIQVQWAQRHRHKLKIGHLRGNRFTLRVRGVDELALATCRSILLALTRRGVPNRFGPQRFGMRGDSSLLGLAILRRDARGFIQAFLGGPHPSESDRVQEARSRFDAGQWEDALRAFPGRMADERQALQTLIRTQGDCHRALATVPKRMKLFLLSAYQSALFNQALDTRLQTLDQVFFGDLAMKHPGHSIFQVLDEEVEQPRAARFEISPTGPLFGFKMMWASGRQAELEAAILAQQGVTLDDFRVGEGIGFKGERRSLRFQVHDPELWYDEGLMLRFWLPPGCYATAVLAEVMKGAPLPEPADQSDVTPL